MLAKRIIPCLDVTAGRVVKGINFVELRDAGDPVEIAARYNEQGADELTFLDITATSDGRDVILHIIEAVASQVFIPLTVGGGVRTVDDVRRLLNAGADKTSFNSAAIANPQVIRDASAKYGAQCIVVAIDAKRRSAEDEQRMGANGLPMGPGWDVYSHGGRKNVGLDAKDGKVATDGWSKLTGHEVVDLAKKFEDYGVESIIYTDIGRDGMLSGINIDATVKLAQALTIPVIASGGLSNMKDIEGLCAVEDEGIEGVICGRAIYSGDLDFEKAQARADELNG